MLHDGLQYGNFLFLHYPFAGLDPTGEIHPLKGYVTRLPGGFCTIYPPLFPLLSAAPYRVLGFGGLMVLPVLSGIGTIAITYWTAWRMGLRFRRALLLILAGATPLVLYAVVFWDHATLMLMTAAAGALLWEAVRTGKMRSAIFAGATLGIGTWLRELDIALALALLLTVGPLLHAGSRWRIALGLGLGFLPGLLGWLCFNCIVYGVWSGPHFMLHSDLGTLEHVRALLNVRIIAEHVTMQLAGTNTPDLLDKALLLLLIGALSTVPGQMIRPFLYLTTAALAGLLIWRADWAHGLFQATPIFILALGRGRSLQQGRRAMFVAWMRRACIAFAVIDFINPIKPEMDWGSRYLLTLLPLLILLALWNWETAWRVTKRRWLWALGGRGPLTAGVMALLIVSLFSQWRGYQAIESDLRYSRAVILCLHAIPSPVVVTDQWWIGPETATEHSPPQFLVNADEPSHQVFFAMLRQLKVRDFTYVGTFSGLELLKWAAQHEAEPFQVTEERNAVGFYQIRFRRVGK